MSNPLSPVVVCPDSKEFRTEVQERTYRRVTALLRSLASVYKSAIVSPNYALLLKAICNETARTEIGSELVLGDGHVDSARADFLFKNFGYQMHFQDPKFFPQIKDDQTYRRFLLALIDILKGGTRAPSIEDGLRIFTDLDVEVLRLWALSDEFLATSPFGIEKNNMLLAAIDIPQPITVDLNVISSGMQFILQQMKPAEALYEGNLRVTEDFHTSESEACRFFDGTMIARSIIKDISPDDEPTSYIDAFTGSGFIKGQITGKIDSPPTLTVESRTIYVDLNATIEDENGVVLNFAVLKSGDIVSCIGDVSGTVINGFPVKIKDSARSRTLCDNHSFKAEAYEEEPWLWCHYEDVEEIDIAVELSLTNVGGTFTIGETVVATLTGATGVVIDWIPAVLSGVLKLVNVVGTFDDIGPADVVHGAVGVGTVASAVYGEDISWQLRSSVQHDTFYTKNKPLVQRFGDNDATLDWWGTRVTIRVNDAPVTPDYIHPLIGKIVIPVGAALPHTWATGSLTGIPEGVAGVQDGDMFVISNGTIAYTFEFDIGGVVVPGNVAVTIGVADTSTQVAQAIYLAINSFAWGVHASPPDAADVVVIRGPHIANVLITESILSFATLTPVGLAGGYVGDQVEVTYTYARRPVYPLEGDLAYWTGDSGDKDPYQFAGDFADVARTSVRSVMSGLLPQTYDEVLMNDWGEMPSAWFDLNMYSLYGVGFTWQQLYAGAAAPNWDVRRLVKTLDVPYSKHVKPCDTPMWAVDWSAFELAYTAIGDYKFGLQGDVYDNRFNRGDTANVVRNFPDVNDWGKYGIYYGGAGNYGNPYSRFDWLKFRYLRYMPEQIVEATQDVINAINSVFINYAFVPGLSDLLTTVTDVLNNMSLLLNKATIFQVYNYAQALYACLIEGERIYRYEGCCRVEPIRQLDVELRMLCTEIIDISDFEDLRLLWGDDGRQWPTGEYYNGGDV